MKGTPTPGTRADSPAPGGEKLSASDKTLRVLEAALRHSRFHEVVVATGLPKATVHRIAATLADHEFITVADGAYLPGPKALALAAAALERLDISALARESVDAALDATGCTVHLGALNRDEIIYVDIRESAKPYRMPSRIGRAIPLHTSAIGKAVLATWPEARLNTFIERSGLPPRTPNSFTSAEAFRREIARIRDRGYAIDDEENEPGIRCIGAAILDHTGEASHGISASTLALEHDRAAVESMAKDVTAAAGRIGARLGAKGR